jgi:macrodomain Ter protein organizer (MatP/YcbG family)
MKFSKLFSMECQNIKNFYIYMYLIKIKQYNNLRITRNIKHFRHHFAVPSVIHVLTQPVWVSYWLLEN